MADIIISLALEVVKCVANCLAPSAGRQISYLRKYKTNFDNLTTEVEKLKVKIGSIQQQVDAAKRNVEKIDENVERWLKKAKEIEENLKKWLERASTFIGDDEAGGKIIQHGETVAAANEIREGEDQTAAVATGDIREDAETAAAAGEAAGEIREDGETAATKRRCFTRLCSDLKMRYQLSKEAVKQLEAVLKHLEAGKFDKISDPVIPKDPRLLNTDYKAFESRASTLKNVISSLSDQNVNIFGIHGMGGIGKTTLAKEVANHPETDKLFDSVIFVEVTEKPDIIKLQQEIAEKLEGLTLSKEETEPTRAGKLCQRLKNEKRILIILDNIWAELNLQQKIGIPLGDGRKLLLTTRSVKVLEEMNSQQNFPVEL